MATPDIGFNWKQIEGSLKQISIGYSGIWGVNSNDEIYYRSGIFQDKKEGDIWHNISGRLKHISSGEYGVWGVNSSDSIYYREGISNLIP